MSQPSRTSIVSFNAGELSPYLDARVDQEKYKSGCRQLQNAILEIYGAARRRPGLQFIAEAKYHTKKCRLEDFRFSTTTTFTLEVGDLYMRFFSNGAQVIKAAPAAWVTATPYVEGDFVTSGGLKYYCIVAHTSAAAFATDLASAKWVLQSIYEIVAPWEEADLFDLQFAQINDVTYIAHPDYPVHKLERVADDDWTLTEVNFITPALLDENLDDTITIASSATALGATTLTATGGTPFQAGHVGSYFQLAHLRQASYLNIDLTANGTSATVKVIGQWNVRTYGIWSADVLVQKSTDAGGTWTTVRSFAGRSDRNVDAVGTADEEALYRLKVENWVSATSTPRAVFEVVDAYVYGLVKVTGYTSGSVVTGTIVKVLESTAGTPLWSEGAWSDVRGYPRAVTLHEQRLVFGGTEFQAQTIWGSVVGDYENFAYGTLDTDAYNYTIGAKERNAIQWLSSHTALLIGTAGGEWVMSSGDDVNPISPTNVVAKRQSNYGSSGLGALLVNDVTLFIQRQARRVREMTYALQSDRYVAADLTLLAEHITEGGVLQIAYQQQRNSIVWGVTEDGKLIGLTYEREQEVVGWHRHVTDGTFESVATIYGAGEDEVWMVVNRTLQVPTIVVVDDVETTVLVPTTKRYIERFNPVEWTAKEDAFFVDSGLSYDGAATGTFAGLDHLKGKTVSILADGAVVPDQQVSQTGTVTLPGGATAEKVHIGLPFTTIINPMRLDVDNIVGITQGQTKRISELNLRFLNTLGCKVGDTLAGVRALSFRDTAMPMDASPPLFTGDKQYEFDGDFDYDVPVFVVQDQPLPLTLLAIVIRYEVGRK
jgi:hypothetical protein